MPYDPLLRQIRRNPKAGTIGPGGPAGGDLSGTYPNPTVAKINTNPLGDTTPTAGNILVGSGTAWVSRVVSGDATLSATGVVTITGATSGRQGPPGLDGEDGQDSLIPGPTGATGSPGATGSAGVSGPPGFDGQDGEDSLIPGPAGSAGSTGATGASGSSGPPGMDGLDADELIIQQAPALVTINSAPGAFGSASFIPTFNVDEYGRVFNASQVAATGASTGLVPQIDRWFGTVKMSDGESSVALNFVNMVAATGGGTASGPLEDTTHGNFLTFTATSATTQTAGPASSNVVTRLNHKPLFFANIFTDTVKTAQRIWIGLSSSITSAGGLGDTDTPGTTNAVSALLFRGSSVAGDANWQVVTANGSTETIGNDVNVSWATATAYRFRIDASNTGSILFYINDTLVKTATLTLPAGTTNLRGLARIYNTTATGKVINVKSLDLYDQVF